MKEKVLLPDKLDIEPDPNKLGIIKPAPEGLVVVPCTLATVVEPEGLVVEPDPDELFNVATVKNFVTYNRN